MDKNKYQLYLKTEHWVKTRKKALRNAGNECQKCGITNWESIALFNLPLNVHHLNYDHLYGEKPEDLMVLCHYCHMLEHDPTQIFIRDYAGKNIGIGSVVFRWWCGEYKDEYYDKLIHQVQMIEEDECGMDRHILTYKHYPDNSESDIIYDCFTFPICAYCLIEYRPQYEKLLGKGIKPNG